MFPFDIVSLLLLLPHTTHSDRHTCSTTAQCQNRTITCAPDEPCYVDCTGNWACRDSTVLCPANRACHIQCLYNQSAYHVSRDYTSYLVCFNMTIAATQSSLLTVNASFGDRKENEYIRTPHVLSGVRWPRTMDYSTIYCPDSHVLGLDPHQCHIHCDGDSLMRLVNINAVQGSLDLQISSTSYDQPWCLRGVRLNCRHDYSSSCLMNTAPPWGCQDYLNQAPRTVCEFHTAAPTETASIGPTLSSSPTQSMYPTAASDGSPYPTESPPVITVPPVTEEPFKKDENPTRNGLSEPIFVLIILVPLLLCACCCIGFGWFMMRGSDVEEGKHCVIDGEYDEEDVEANGTIMNTDPPPEYVEDDESSELSDINSSSERNGGVRRQMLDNTQTLSTEDSSDSDGYTQ
eukprot:129891_1